MELLGESTWLSELHCLSMAASNRTPKRKQAVPEYYIKMEVQLDVDIAVNYFNPSTHTGNQIIRQNDTLGVGRVDVLNAVSRDIQLSHSTKPSGERNLSRVSFNLRPEGRRPHVVN